MDQYVPPWQAEPGWSGYLMKDGRKISSVACRHVPPFKLPDTLHIKQHFSKSVDLDSTTFQLPFFELHELQGSISGPHREWWKFVHYLHTYKKVGHVSLNGWELLIQPPRGPVAETEPLRVRYRPSTVPPFVFRQPHHTPPLVIPSNLHHYGLASPTPRSASTATLMPPALPPHKTNSIAPAQPATPATPEVAFVGESLAPNVPRANVARVHPKYLNSLEVTHTDWSFGGVAELIDNARDAGASRLDINIEELRWPGQQRTVPVLQVIDNGHGMTHEDIIRMLSFGHDSPDEDNIDQIGRFGVGFKTGAMRVGDDVLVLTQSQKTRSFGFLSKSYNKDKNELEVPIVTYRNYDGTMELDMELQTKAEAKAAFKAVATFSPFDKFRIGSEFDKIGKGKTGTRIFVFNLKTWGGSKSLFQWESEEGPCVDGDKKGDIIIQGKRVRSRNGQTSLEVPLDYSLREYVKVLFLVPNMSIFVQGSRVRTMKLAESLRSTKQYRGFVLGKRVNLTLGFQQIEYERGNCGIFLYWHKRLIKAYTRVGRMVRNADYGRGVIGVIDITELMNFGNGDVGVLASKQGFQDCEQYNELEKWLADMAHKYCDDKDNIEVLNPDEVAQGVRLVADQEWVQCDKCQQWRILPEGVVANDLPSEWFCYMKPFKGKCEMPQDTVGSGIVTVGVQRGKTAAGALVGNGSDQSGVADTDSASEESGGFTLIRATPRAPAKEPYVLSHPKEPIRVSSKEQVKEANGSKELQKRKVNAIKEIQPKEVIASKLVQDSTVSKGALTSKSGVKAAASKAPETVQPKFGGKMVSLRSAGATLVNETPDAPKFKRLRRIEKDAFVLG